MIELFFGDCLELLPTVADNSVDMVLCDLSYGTTNCKWDSLISLEQLWEQYQRVCKPNAAVVLFAQIPFNIALGASNIKELRYEWIWEKTNATGHLNANKMPLKAHENILVFYKKLPTYNPQKTSGHKPMNSYTKGDDGEIYGKTKIGIKGGGSTERFPRTTLNFSNDKQICNLHPTQKSLKLCEYLIKTYTNENDIVLDNCMGSGTTGIACKNLNRQFMGMEKDLNYFEIAKERIEKN